jgi:hypothetical protein
MLKTSAADCNCSDLDQEFLFDIRTLFISIRTGWQKAAFTAKPNSLRKKHSLLSAAVYYHSLRFNAVLFYRLKSTQHDRVWAAFGSEQIVLGWC